VATKISMKDVSFADLANNNREIIDILEARVKELEVQLKEANDYINSLKNEDGVIATFSVSPDCGFDNDIE